LNFPGQNPLGHHLILWKDSHGTTRERGMEIVGVSKDARYGDLKREIPLVSTSRTTKAARSRTT